MSDDRATGHVVQTALDSELVRTTKTFYLVRRISADDLELHPHEQTDNRPLRARDVTFVITP